MTINLDMVFRADASGVKPAADAVKREMDGVANEVTEATAALDKHAAALERDAEASRKAAQAARDEAAARERVNNETVPRPRSTPTGIPTHQPPYGGTNPGNPVGGGSYPNNPAYRPPTQQPPANDNALGFRRQNAGYQYLDTAQSLYGGMGLPMVLAQQGPQLLQIYAGNGGVNAALKDFTTIAGAAIRAVAPLAAVLAVGYGAYKLLASYSVESGLAVSDTTRALAEQAAPLGTLQGQIGALTSLQETYNEAIRASAEASSAATSIIIANSEREFRAKQSLLELEQKRIQASIELQRSEIAIAQNQLKSDLGASVNTRLDLERRGFGDEDVGRFVALPDDVTGLDKTRALLEQNPLTDKIKEMRANLELTELAAQKLTGALEKTFNTNPYGSGDLPIVGPVPLARPNIEMEGLPGEVKGNEAAGRSYRDIVQSAQQRIEQMRLEARVSGETGIAAERLRFELDLLQEAQEKGQKVTPEQRREIEQLGEAYAQAANQAARLKLGIDAEFDRQQIGRSPAEQRIASQLKGAGLPVDLSSYEAGLLRTNEVLREQVKAWEDIRDVGRDAIDQIVDGASDGLDGLKDAFDEIGKDIIKQVTALGVANPLKNAVYGDTLPTMQSVGGISGFFGSLLGGKNPALNASKALSSSVAAMTVSAGTVVVNGSVGLGTGISGLGGAANDNLAKPLGTASGTALPSGDIASYIADAAKKRSIDPAIALAVARSEGGLESWNLQSGVVKNGVREPSFGPFQLYKGGGLGNVFQQRTGMDPAHASSGPAGVDFALDHASKNGWGSWYGAARVGINKWDGIGANNSGISDSATQTAAAFTKVTGAASSTASGLGTLGSGFANFGNALSKFPTAPAAGGGGIGGWLSKLFGSTFVPNGAQATVAAGGAVGLYDSGGWTGDGDPRDIAGFVHGKEFVVKAPVVAKPGVRAFLDALNDNRLPGFSNGGFVPSAGAYSKLGSSASPWMPSQAASVSITHINNAPVEVETRDTTDERGGRKVEFVISERVSSAITKPGGAAKRSMEQGYGLKQTRVRR